MDKNTKLSNNLFVQYMDNQIDNRNDICHITCLLHKRVCKRLKAFGILMYSDLTESNINRFDRYLHTIIPSQTTIAKQHQVVRTYIKRAIMDDLMDERDNPYRKVHIARGRHKIRVRLTDDEIIRLKAYYPLNDSLYNTKQMFMFQIYSGVSFSDMQSLLGRNIRQSDGYWLEGLRNKNLSAYRCYLMDDAVNIIKEYMSKPDRYIFPRITTQTYNKHLKVIAEVVGIRNLSSHVGRHTFASWVLRKGVPITTIQRMMGHTQLRTTMIYAELDDATIKSDMIRAFG